MVTGQRIEVLLDEIEASKLLTGEFLDKFWRTGVLIVGLFHILEQTNCESLLAPLTEKWETGPLSLIFRLKQIFLKINICFYF